ncbi:unnamed protein product, partial [Iphiclides podalirius]
MLLLYEINRALYETHAGVAASKSWHRHTTAAPDASTDSPRQVTNWQRSNVLAESWTVRKTIKPPVYHGHKVLMPSNIHSAARMRET